MIRETRLTPVSTCGRPPKSSSSRAAEGESVEDLGDYYLVYVEVAFYE